MTFSETFLRSASSKTVANYTTDPVLLLPNLYEPAQDNPVDDTFLSLLGGGSVQSEQLFTISFAPMADVGLLLYTTEGAGTFKSPRLSVNHALTSMSVLFWDCSQPFTLTTSIVPWHFYIFFLKGRQLNFFHGIAKNNRAYLYQLPPYSPLHQHFHTLLGIPQSYFTKDGLIMHNLLTNILCGLSLSFLPDTKTKNEKIPSYLYELKDRLDHHYQDSFSLSQYEELFSINKYRICREFSQYFGSSPLAYLTQVRLAAAKEMLLTTDLNVYEISSHVGYENVNHFISLFRKYNGTTPKSFKQKAQENQSALHSPLE